MVSRGGISSKREAAMFLAQMSYESAGLVVKKDPLCMVTQCTYSYPNTPGIGYPGKYYWGRGYLKLV
jgi:chitinase